MQRSLKLRTVLDRGTDARCCSSQLGQGASGHWQGAGTDPMLEKVAWRKGQWAVAEGNATRKHLEQGLQRDLKRLAKGTLE